MEHAKKLNVHNQFLVDHCKDQRISSDLIDFFSNNTRRGITKKFTFLPTTEAEVAEIIDKIRSNAAGVDNLNLKMIKLIYPFCKSALAHIINTLFETGVFPTQ